MMKKYIFLFLLATFCSQLIAQKKVSAMTEATTVNSDAVIPIVQSGANYKATKANLQKELTADVDILETDVTTIDLNTAGVVGWSFASDGDTLFVTYSGSTWKLLAVAAQETDITAPTITSIEVGTLSEDTVVVVWSEAMDEDSIPTGVVVKEAGVTYGIGTYFFSNSTTLKIPLDSSAQTETLYSLSYTRPGTDDFQDTAGNKILSFSDADITNNIPAASSIYAYMLFENNDDDEMGVMNFTWTGSESYRTTGSPPQGTYSTNTSAGGVLTTNESHDLGTSWSFTGWWNGGNDSDTDARYILDLDGADIWIDYTDGANYIEGTVGGAGFQSDLIADVAIEWKWVHIGITYDGVNGYLRTYLDGLNVSNDSVVGVGADANGVVDIGWSGTALRFYGDYDDIQFYKDEVLSDAQILWGKEHPGVPIDGNPDPPIPSDSIEVLWYEDWEDFPTTNYTGATSPAGIPNTYFPLYMDGFESLGSDDANDPDYADNADIVGVTGGYGNVLRSFYPSGQCCTGATSDLAWANGGTGIDLYAYITDGSTYYNEVYVSYNLRIMPGFDNSAGFKQPGTLMMKGYPVSNPKLMIVDWVGAAGDLNLAYYTTAYWTYISGVWTTTWGSTHYRTSSKDYDFAKDTWINVTLRCYAGTSQGVNGRVEVFLDGIYFGVAEPNVPFRDAGDPSGWYLVNIATFMGGEGSAYTSPKDQYITIDEIVVWRPTSGSSMIQGSTPSPVGRDISGTLEQIMIF